MSDLEATRPAFEAWVLTTPGVQLRALARFASGDYAHSWVAAQWSGWAAAVRYLGGLSR